MHLLRYMPLSLLSLSLSLHFLTFLPYWIQLNSVKKEREKSWPFGFFFGVSATEPVVFVVMWSSFLRREGGKAGEKTCGEKKEGKSEDGGKEEVKLVLKP